MAVTSLRFFTGIDHPYDFQAGANTTYELYKSNARRNIAYYHVEQYVDPARAYLGQILQNPPSAILNQLRSAISGTASDPTTLVMFDQCWDGANWVDAGHAVSPYAIEDQSGGVYRVRVYDNNAPGDTSRYAVINTTDDTWSYNMGGNCGTWSGSASTSSLGLVPISQFPEQPPCPSGWSGGARTTSTLNETSSGQVWLSGQGHLLITDVQGRRIGYVDDQFVNEIPGAYESIIVGGLEIAMEPIYTLPLSDTYTVLLDGQTLTQTETVAVTQFGPGYAVSVDGVALRPTSQDRLTIAPDGTQVSYRNAVDPEAAPSGDKEATLTLALDGVSEGNQLRVRDADVGFEQVVTLTADVEGGQLAFSSAQAGGGKYALEIKRVSAAGEQGFMHASVAISATDTHYVEYGAWNGSGPMTLHVDHGSDGTTDETLELQNQAHHIYLPLIMRNYTPAVTSPSYVHR
jgi:hypothetical protein